MDENENPLAEVSEPAAPSATTLKARFKGFALYHFAYSFVFLLLFAFVLLCSEFLFILATPDSRVLEHLASIFLFSLSVLGLILYFPLGILAAKQRRWTAPSLREKVLSILRPCGIAVLWALLVMLLYCAELDLPGVMLLISIFSFISIFFAAPSSYFFSVCFTVLMESTPGLLAFSIAALPSAVLPPLLFALGSFWQAKRQKILPER